MDAASVVRTLFAAVATRDVEAIRALVDDETEFWPQGTAEFVGRTEPYRGEAGVQEYFDDLSRSWQWLELEPGDFRAAGEGVIAFGRARGVRTDGHHVAVPLIWTFKVRDGRLRFARVVATVRQAERVLRS
jgi:ketosteroid isomerase-like protein